MGASWLRVVVVGAIAGACATPAPAPDDAAIDGMPADAAIDGPVADAAIDAVAIDGPAIDAAAVDAPPADAAVVDGVPADAAIDGPAIDAWSGPVPPLAFDTTFSDDGALRLGVGYPGPIVPAGPYLAMCGVATYWFDDITYATGVFMFRATPGTSQALFGVVALPASSQGTACQAIAAFPDGRMVVAYYRAGVFLATRLAGGTVTAAQPVPEPGSVRALYPAPGGRVAAVFDGAVWLLDDQLAPVPSFGVAGRLAIAGPVVGSRQVVAGGARLDLVTAGAIYRVDLSTGTFDPTFGVAGVVTLPGPLTVRGIVPRPGAGLLLYGVTTGYDVDGIGAVVTVALPGIDPQAVVEDRVGGGAYLIAATDTPFAFAVKFTVTRVEPATPTAWTVVSTQALTPPDLLTASTVPVGRESFRVAGAAWTDTGRLGVWLTTYGQLVNEFNVYHWPHLVVLTR